MVTNWLVRTPYLTAVIGSSKTVSDFRREMIRRKLAQDVSEEEIVHLIHNMEQMLHLSYSDESVDYLRTSARFLVSRGIKMSDKHAFFPMM